MRSSSKLFWRFPGFVDSSADFFDLERDRVLANTWFCVGIAADIPNAGDLLSYDFASIPLLLLPDKAGAIRAFHNVCSHRGVQLVAELRNTRGGITCPYHSWTYDLDGRLLRRPRFCGEPHCPDDKQQPLFREARLPCCHFYAILYAMKATIDAAGRIVVPKSLRLALGLKAGQPLEIVAGDGRLEIEIAATPMKLQKRGKGLVAVPDTKLPALTADQVRDTLERVRR